MCASQEAHNVCCERDANIDGYRARLSYLLKFRHTETLWTVRENIKSGTQLSIFCVSDPKAWRESKLAATVVGEPEKAGHVFEQVPSACIIHSPSGPPCIRT